MGTWGVGSFENDNAQEFLTEVMEDGPVALGEAFDVALDPDLIDLEAPEGERVVAAAEILAAVLSGHPVTLQAEDGRLVAWAKDQDARSLEPLREPAVAALERVLEASSELRELWDEAEEAAAWRAGVKRLQGALS